MIKPQKALHLYLELEKKRTTVQEDTFAIFEKYDGWYGFKRVSTSLEFYDGIISRQRRVIPALDRLSRSVAHFEQVKQIDLKGTIIFEILVEGVPVFKDLNGILNRSKGDCEAKGAYLMVHDFIPDGQHDMPFEERYRLAKQYVVMLGHRMVRIAPLITYGNHERVQEEAEKIWARRSTDKSDEGAIGKRVDAPYSEGKKNKDIIKVKSEVTLEMVVVGMEEGNDKYEGTLGKIVCRQANGICHPLSGMTDAERDAWWDNPSLIVGKIVEVQAMQVLENGSLREGRFKAVRHDKDISEID